MDSDGLSSQKLIFSLFVTSNERHGKVNDVANKKLIYIVITLVIMVIVVNLVTMVTVVSMATQTEW